ncbi:MAG: ribonuclease P protein component [Patescibacteria group bacterium]
MLPRRMRLQRGKATHTGKEMRAVSPHFSVSIRLGQSGAGAVISKKTEKTSVGRHRLKRRILAVLRPWCASDKTIVVYARSGSPSLPYAVLNTELSELLTKLLGPAQIS